MSTGITVKTNAAAIAREVGALRALADDPRLIDAAGESMAGAVRENFRKLNMLRSRPGKRGKGFYEQAHDATHYSRRGALGVISVNGPRGIRLRLKGGVVKAKPGKSLAIPVHDAVIGVRAREVFDELNLVAIKNPNTGKGVLIQPGDGDDFGTVFYALTRKTTHRPDPSVLPSDAELADASKEGAREAVRYLSRKS